MKTVLIVDDQEQNLYLLQFLLEANGYRVTTATNGAQALELARRDPPSVIITDILMPVMDGFALCREWRKDERLKDIPFVFYTATYTDPKDEDFALSLGADRFIVKPTDPVVFLDIVRQVLDEVKDGSLKASVTSGEEEPDFLKVYSERLVKKLEDKMVQLERVHRRLKALYQASTVAAGLQGRDQLLAYILRAVIEAMGVEKACYFDYDEERNEFTLMQTAGFAFPITTTVQAEISFRRGEERGLVGLVGQTRQPLILPDTRADLRWVPLDPAIGSALFVPVIHDDDLFGVAGFLSDEVNYFSALDADYLMTLANNMGSALKNMQLLERLTHSEARYRRLTDNLPDIIFQYRLKPAPGFEYVSPAATTISGYEPDDYYADPDLASKLVHSEDRSCWEQHWRGQGILSEPLIVRWMRRDGAVVWTEHRHAPIHDEAGDIVALHGIIRDITQRKRAEQEAEQLQLQLIQAQKMEAVGRLTAGIAHDFNNVLTAINGFAELLQLQTPTQDPLQQYVRGILTAGRHAADLVRQLMAFSRIQPIQMQVVDLNTVLEEARDTLQRMIGESIQMTMALANQACPVSIDPVQLQQVIMNLASNARDAMPYGGRLVFETASVTLNDIDVAACPTLPAGEYVMLTVSDTGCGMTSEVQTHIFEPFFTTKEMGKGTGIGLTTVCGIIKQCGGDIRLSSQVGEGTTFRIYLPRASEAVQLPAGDATKPSGALAGGEAILLVEDEKAVRDFTHSALELQGYCVIEATTAEAALQVAADPGRSIHLLVTDVVLPGMSGAELAAQLTRQRPGLPVLFVSGYADDMARQHGVLDPGANLLHKPYSAFDLVRKVRSILDAAQR